MQRWKRRGGKSQGGEVKKWEDQKKRKSKTQEDAGARKGRKVAIPCVFPIIWGSGGSKSNLAKAAGAEPAGQMRDEKLHALVVRSTFVSKKAGNTSRSDHSWKLRCPKSARRCDAKHVSKLKMYKRHHAQTTFGSWDVEKVHVVVARNTFPSQKCKTLRVLSLLWR